MPIFTVEISTEEEKSLLTNMISIQDWLDNFVHESARRIIDAIIEDKTDRNSKKMTMEAKLLIIKNTVLKSAVEKNAEIDAELLK